MALQTTQIITRAAPILIPAYNAVSATDTFVPGPDVFLDVKNGSGASINVNVAIQAPGQIAGVTYIQNVTVAVAAGSERMIGPFPASYFADPVTGLATVTYSGIASVTAAVLSLINP